MLQHKVLLGGLTVLAVLAAATSSAPAQSTNARPIVIMNAAELEPSALPLVSDDARQSFTNALKKIKSGDSLAYVFAASPNGKSWASRSVTPSDKQIPSADDLARMALETCEYWTGASCLILSVNGHDARDAAGTWPVQPRMLDFAPSAFDAQRVPFVTEMDRSRIGDYGRATDQRALVLTDSGGWYWDTEKTIFEAVARAAADCKKDNPPEDCLLYAVNDRVVLQP